MRALCLPQLLRRRNTRGQENGTFSLARNFEVRLLVIFSYPSVFLISISLQPAL